MIGLKQCFIIYLNDYGLPGFCSGEKKYFGTKDDLLNFYLNVKKTGIEYIDLNKLYAFINSKKSLVNAITYNEHVLGEKATVLGEKSLSINSKEWQHINVWGCDYNMKFDKCNISVLWIRHNRKYYRCVKPDFLNLLYSGSLHDDYIPIKHFWGQPGYFKIDNEWLRSSLYVIDKQFKNKQELLEDIENFDINTVDFQEVINEVFGDG